MFDSVRTVPPARTTLASSVYLSWQHACLRGVAVIHGSTPVNDWSITMIIRTFLTAAIAAITLLTATGCAVSRGQETVGSYIDDAGITTAVKTRLFEDKRVAGSSISVETLNGTVMHGRTVLVNRSPVDYGLRMAREQASGEPGTS